MIRVLLADDHSLVRAALARIIEDSGDIGVVAEAADGREAILQVWQTMPDVVVIDISMPNMDGLEAVGNLRSIYPKLPILIITMHEEEQYVVRAIGAGAKGYLTKRSAPEQLVDAIRKVFAGGCYLSDTAAEFLAQHQTTSPYSRSPLDTLSNREIQVSRHLALGHTVREIAEAYHLSINTVHTYRLRLLRKLNLRNNAELSLFGFQHHLVEI
jgi:two-component system, NarL family, invasion response regulator UvrY